MCIYFSLSHYKLKEANWIELKHFKFEIRNKFEMLLKNSRYKKNGYIKKKLDGSTK